MNWQELTSTVDLKQVTEESKNQWVILFKHSTRCPISSMAKMRLERAWREDAPFKPYYLDLIKYRDISNAVAQEFEVMHESPQVILLKNGEAVYHDSHMGISFDSLLNQVKN